MKIRIIQIFMVVVLLGMVAYWGNEYKIYAVHGKAEFDHKDNERQIEPMGEKGKEEDGLGQVYGTYRIIEFCPTMYWYNFSFDCLTKQEADMMLGRVVEIQENLLVTYDSLRRLGTRDGRDAFTGNHVIEQISIENPQYEWIPFSMDTERDESFLYSSLPSELWEYQEEIEGEMSVQIAGPFGEHHYLALKDKLIMYSTLTDSFFLLEKWDTKTDDAVSESNLSEEEKRTLLQEVYGTYSVIAFLPTKFYPALDSGGDVRLPQEEADMMIGMEVTIGESLFVTYDNFRLPNSEFMDRSMDDFRIEAIEILNPDYQIEVRLRDEIYGLRDEMLPEEMVQREYLEISVYPGYVTNAERNLPQLYLLDNGNIIMYAMGEYFLLEK